MITKRRKEQKRIIVKHKNKICIAVRDFAMKIGRK